MNTKSPECYTAEPQARCLRVEISPGRLLLLPLNQFAFAELTVDDKEQLLHLSFATHEIMVRGNPMECSSNSSKSSFGMTVKGIHRL